MSNLASRKPADALPAELFARYERIRPLVWFLGVTGVCVGSFFALAAIAMLAGAVKEPLAGAGAAIVFFFASMMLVPSIHLVRYQRAIRRASAHNSSGALADLLRLQRRFWRFVGVATVIWLSMLALLLAVPLHQALRSLWS